MRHIAALFAVALSIPLGLLVGFRSNADGQDKPHPRPPATARLSDVDRGISAHAERMMGLGEPEKKDLIEYLKSL